MHRYIAFAWNHRSAEKTSLTKTLLVRLRSVLPDWQCALATEGLHVYHFGARTRSSQVYLLGQNAGVVLGTLFERCNELNGTSPNRNLREVSFNRQETQKVQETEGQHLIDHYWGRYVAILRENGSTRVRVLRDPTGAVPCLFTEFHGLDIVCSHINDCEMLGLIDSAINWDHVAAYLYYPQLVTKDTGLDGVSQVQAGECVTVGADRSESTYYWRPDKIHDARIVENRQQAMFELRNTIQHCVGAWASCYKNILHELSGGLDSAVVLACLSKTLHTTNIICENFFMQGGEGDERAFAQKAAKHTGIALFETHLHASERMLEDIIGHTKVATPTRIHLHLEDIQPRNKLAKMHDVEAVFSGQGGDHFFQQEGTALIAAEYAWHHGMRPEILDVIADTSRLTRKSVWSVMATVLTAGLLRRQEEPYDRHWKPTLLLSETTRDALDLSSIRHPWVDFAKHLPGAKVLQIFDIVDSQNFYNFSRQYADTVHPLISQPVIELCIQIPSYMLAYGGIDRALVREAFRGLIPPEIIARTNKGATTNFVLRVLAQNLPFLREFLLEGNLIREGVLDQEKTESALTESRLVRDRYSLRPIINAIWAETWLRMWIGDRKRVAV